MLQDSHAEGNYISLAGILNSYGLRNTFSYICFAAFIHGIFALVGTTVSGWLSYRFDNRWLLFWYYSLRGTSLLLLPYALFEGSFTLRIIFSVFYGLDWIATIPPTIGISRQIFGMKESGIVYGWILASHQAGAAVAAFGGGMIYQILKA